MSKPICKILSAHFSFLSLLFVLVLSSNLSNAQKITVFPEYKYGMEAIIEFTGNGCIMERIEPKEDKYNIVQDYDYYVTKMDTGFREISRFDSRTSGFNKMRFMNRFIMKDKILVVCLKEIKKPVKFQLYGFIIDKNTLKTDPNPILLLERDGTFNSKTGFSYFQRDNFYGISFSYSVLKETLYSMAEIAIFNEEIKLSHSFPACLFLQEDLGSSALPEKDYRLIRERSANGNQFMKLPALKYSMQPLLKDEFVFTDAAKNLVIWMPVWSNSGKNDRDIFSHVIFKTLKADGSVSTKTIDISLFELYDVSLIYNNIKNEIFLTGPYKGDAFGKYTAFTSALYSYPDLTEKVKSTHPFSPELSKSIHTFYDKQDMGEQGIPFDVDMMIPVAGPDGSYYSFYQYFYSQNITGQRRVYHNIEDTKKSFTELRSIDYRPYYLKRNDYGPVIITALNADLTLKWTNMIPKWTQAEGDHLFSGFHPMATSNGLAVIYNELTENLAKGLMVNEPKTKPDRLRSGLPVVTMIDNNGKMDRKTLLTETVTDGRLFDLSNAISNGDQKAVFILKTARATLSWKFNFVELDYSR